MADYTFKTVWRFRAPLERVWPLIHDYQQWPRWWSAIAEARQIKPGDAEGVGEVARFTFRAPLLYKLRFTMTTTHIRSPNELDGHAVGELEGDGRWRLSTEGDETVVRYDWNVQTTSRVMNLLAPIARPLFTWSHDWVMESGRKGLERVLARERRPT